MQFIYEGHQFTLDDLSKCVFNQVLNEPIYTLVMYSTIVNQNSIKFRIFPAIVCNRLLKYEITYC